MKFENTNLFGELLQQAKLDKESNSSTCLDTTLTDNKELVWVGNFSDDIKEAYVSGKISLEDVKDINGEQAYIFANVEANTISYSIGTKKSMGVKDETSYVYPLEYFTDDYIKTAVANTSGLSSTNEHKYVYLGDVSEEAKNAIESGDYPGIDFTDIHKIPLRFYNDGVNELCVIGPSSILNAYTKFRNKEANADWQPGNPVKVVNNKSVHDWCENYNVAISDFNEPIEICAGVNSCRNLLESCTSFNQPFTIPEGVIDCYSMLSCCSSFNQELTLPSSVKYCSSMLYGCSSFNHPLVIPNSVTHITSILSDCKNFNSKLILPDKIEICSFILAGCESFNQPIVIPDTVKVLASAFRGCLSFNQPLSIPNGVRDMHHMLAGCIVFNSTLELPDEVDSMSSMLYGCTSFNKPIKMPKTEKYILCLGMCKSLEIMPDITNLNLKGKSLKPLLRGCTKLGY